MKRKGTQLHKLSFQNVSWSHARLCIESYNFNCAHIILKFSIFTAVCIPTFPEKDDCKGGNGLIAFGSLSGWHRPQTKKEGEAGASAHK